MSEIEKEVQQADGPEKPKSTVRLKLFMALLVGLATAAIGCITGIYSLRGPHSWVCLPQRSTVWSQMRFLSEYLDEYKEEHGSYPLALEEMTSQWKGYDKKPLEESDIGYRIQDGWKRPMIYSSDGETWELLSFGADGQPGGIGLDSDIRCTNSDTDELNFYSELYKDFTPTIKQVLQSEHFGASISMSCLAGLSGFLLAVYQFFFQRSSKVDKKADIIIATVAIIVACAIFVYIHVSIQSIASGH